MATAKRVTGQLEGKAGEAYGYKLDTSYQGVGYLIVSRIDWPNWGLQETRIVPAGLVDGAVVMLVDAEGTMSLSRELALCSHADALRSIGYSEVV